VSDSAASTSPPSRFRRIAFTAWATVLVVLFGVGFFGLTSLVIGWFEPLEAVAGPVTELGYGALVGILLTGGVLVQLRAPHRKIAAMQQVALTVPALLIGWVLSSDPQILVPALIIGVGAGILLVLHPARGEFLQWSGGVSPALLTMALLGAVPLITYALSIGEQARRLTGPPHHVLRLSTMAALAIAILFTAILASFQTSGWRIPSWAAGLAAVVFGLASAIHPNHPGAAEQVWGIVAVAGGVLFIATAEWEARRSRHRALRDSLGP
jgi:hypothetical protein